MRFCSADPAYDFVNYRWGETLQSSSLYILDDALNVVGSLTGLGQDEQIYSVRFDGDLCYFVTFRQTDPLFAADLSDPARPVILSALKLPGFSCQRGFLQFQKIALCIAERRKKRIPRFLQFQIVRIRTLRLCRAVFLHTGAAFKKALAAAQNGFCRLPKLFQCVKGAFGLLLQFLFHPS